MTFQVAEPILNSPFAEPGRHWFIPEGALPEERDGRRPPFVFQPREGELRWDLRDGTLRPLPEYDGGWELALVSLVRQRLADWRAQGYPGVTRTTLDLLNWWRRDGRAQPLFFAQLEAAETVIFLREARADFLQGVGIPADEPTVRQAEQGYTAFTRYACKMATGSGKTTVMGMLAAWSILNKAEDRQDKRFSDLVLIVCPNVTIRDRLRELDVEGGEGSLYRTRDLVPPHLMPRLAQGRIIVTNWHVFEQQSPSVGGQSSRVVRTGHAETRRERVTIKDKTTTARGSRYFTQADFDRLVAAGEMVVVSENRDGAGRLVDALVDRTFWVESDAALVARILGRSKGKQNILVLNDEAHHAYRIRREDDDEEDLFADEAEAEEFVREATIWIEGLDRIHKQRGINFCVDLSATPYFLGRVGPNTGRPFPWVVSDFGLIDAIESGLVKIPQLAVRDNSWGSQAEWFNLWRWVMDKLTPAERGGKRGNPKPEAVLKWAHHPLALIAGEWETLRLQWAETDEQRPPVLIVVCKDIKLATLVHEWIGEGASWPDVPPFGVDSLRNTEHGVVTIRVDSKVVTETDGGAAKSDEHRWMRFTLDSVGRLQWPVDRAGRPIHPPGFVELAEKLERPLHPPGRDVRCIVSVGMLTEGWDANTVTHVVGLRPFMSQLLCEQVVGRALRRASYDLDDSGRFTEEVAQVLGVPFEIIPFKATAGDPPKPRPKHRVFALPQRGELEIRFPRVEGYTQAVRNRITVDWDAVPSISLDPGNIPTEVQMAAALPNNQGRIALFVPGRVREMSLEAFLAGRRTQQLVFEAAATLTRDYIQRRGATVPAHALFPQLQRIIARFIDSKVKRATPETDLRLLFLAPYYGWFLERLVESLKPDADAGEAPEIPVYERHREPGSTAEVDFWTTKPILETVRSHVNYLVADTKTWEQQAAKLLDGSRRVHAWVKNAGLGFAIPYIHDGVPHEYQPDFIVRLHSDPVAHLILETKGGRDQLWEVKAAAARRWVAAVNADGAHGQWAYEVAHNPQVDVPHFLEQHCPAPAHAAR